MYPASVVATLATIMLQLHVAPAGGVSVDVKTLSEREREKLTRKLVQVHLNINTL